ncbi:MAG: hypothetical protein FJ220_06830, partial [Kiritimatiellaceae bacterium]|nr:hypothetical protein [Kiritimatiellaceae bacterium]
MKINMRLQTTKFEVVALLLLFILAAVFRFWMLGYASFGTDSMEFYKLAKIGQSIGEIWRNPPWLNQIPLNETFSLIMVKIGLPATPFVVRLPFAIMGVMAVFFVWKLARRWFGPGAALSVLLLAVFNPYQIYFARTAYHYSGALCWSAAMFLIFWSIWESFRRKEAPSGKDLTLWFLAAVVACHMHMSVWVVAGLQGLLMLIYGLKLKTNRTRFLGAFSLGSVLLTALMARWLIRAVQEVIKNSVGGGHHTGSSAKSEFLRLLPAYFAGENLAAFILLLVAIALTILAVFRDTESGKRLRSFVLICTLHILVLLLYVAIIGSGIAKITYFSSIWPQFILLVGIGAFAGVRSMVSQRWRTGIYAVLAGAYIALTAWPVYAMIRLEGSPTPYYKINDWILSNLPAETPVLTDRWYEPWNELAVHNPGNINYTFTVPDDPIASYSQFNWRKTVENFFEKYPEAAFLEMERGKYESTFGPWTFPQQYFARSATVTNNAVMMLRKTKVFPLDTFSSANTNRIVTRIFYNTPEDLAEAAKRNGRDVLRIYNAGWGYAKPGWQQGQFEDYRLLRQSASLAIYNLQDVPLQGTLEIAAATSERSKSITVAEAKTTFSPGRIRQ